MDWEKFRSTWQQTCPSAGHPARMEGIGSLIGRLFSSLLSELSEWSYREKVGSLIVGALIRLQHAHI